MRTSIFRASSAFVLASLAAALLTVAPAAQTPQPSVVRQAPPSLLSQFDIHAGTVQILNIAPNANGDYIIPIQVGGQQRTISAQPYDLRGAGYQLLLQDATGVHVMPTPACVTFRGILLEEPTTTVVATIENGTITASIHEELAAPGVEGKVWVVQPINTVQPTAGASVHIVFEASDSAQLPYQCGTGPAQPQNLPAPVGVDVIRECDIALEADVQFYQQNGSNVTVTQNDITSIMNQIEFIYNRDCDIQYNITTIMVTTTGVYTSNSASTLLNQFAGRWNSVHAGIPRDTAHLFTGRSINGGTIGIAYLGTICVTSSSYGLSQSRYTSNYNLRVSLTSHELGHSWSAGHCNSSSPCYIMCSSNGGCNGITLFSPVAISQITSFAATRTCLTLLPSTPIINSVNPSTVTVFNPGSVTLSGSGFTGATGYRVGLQSFTSGFSVINDNTMLIAMPTPTIAGYVTVDVTNSAGTSSIVVVQYTLTSPPKLVLTPVIQPTGGIATFDFAGTPGR
ncbi:MAG TPA: hypothetical protein EYQ84_05515, partial [Nitrospinaceae bacterium]|nr:hypothetical protein [Nitrospinaceae bacterium]